MLSLTREQVDAAIGDDVISSDGETIGTVTDIYYDVNRPDTHGWIGVFGGPLKLQHRIIPLDAAQIRGERIYVPFTKDRVMNAPEFHDADMTDDNTRKLWSHYWNHYGMRWADYEREYGRSGERRNDDMGVVGDMDADRDIDATDEDELVVEMPVRAVSVVRLRKWETTRPIGSDRMRRESDPNDDLL